MRCAGRLVPTFTRDGYKVADVPKPLFEKLKAAVDAGVQRWDSLRAEGNIDVIYTKEVRVYGPTCTVLSLT